MSGTVSAKSLIGELKRKRPISPLAGKLAPKEMLVDVVLLEREYFERRPDAVDPNQVVSFGTSGHRGSPLDGTFTEAHMLAITLAICATPEQKAKLQKLSVEDVKVSELAGEPIIGRLACAP